MAVTVEGTPSLISDGDNYTAETGSDRLLVWAFATETGSGSSVRTITSIVYGSQAMTQAHHAVRDIGSRNHTDIWYVKEADIPSGSNTFDVTWSSSQNGVSEGVAYTLAGVDQTTPVGHENEQEYTNDQTPSVSYTSTDGSVILALVCQTQSGGPVSTVSGFTKDADTVDAGVDFYYSMQRKEETTGASAAWEPDVGGSSKDGMLGVVVFAAAAGGIALDSAPSTMAKAETGVSFVVSNPATVPTTGNTTVINSGDALTVTSVTGSDPYTINCTVPLDITKQAGSFAWTITVDAENVVSSSIPLTVQSGWSNIVLASPSTSVGYMLNGYTGDVPATGDTMEFETTTDLSPGTDSEWIWDVAPTVDQVVARRVIQVIGTVGATADVTFSQSTGDIPVITLFGDNPLTVEAGTTYTDPGFSASDTEDGSITGSVVVAGDTVLTQTLGAYNVTYDVTDSDLNAVQEIRVVNVTDTISPVIIINGASSLEVLVDGTYTELGAEAEDSFEGNLTGSVAIAGDTVNEAVIATYVVTYDVSDSSANAAVQKTRTVDVVAELTVTAGASNEDMIRFFRNATGLATYSFNELAIAYYQQAGSTAMASFNDSLRSAQEAVTFVGLSPDDWRNL